MNRIDRESQKLFALLQVMLRNLMFQDWFTDIPGDKKRMIVPIQLKSVYRKTQRRRCKHQQNPIHNVTKTSKLPQFRDTPSLVVWLPSALKLNVAQAIKARHISMVTNDTNIMQQQRYQYRHRYRFHDSDKRQNHYQYNYHDSESMKPPELRN
uniref:Uncharacterized protein n=1 Tax=Panagrellus redivivus TaxID=6233 RepID=A0A7E4VYM1_PANRE